MRPAGKHRQDHTVEKTQARMAEGRLKQVGDYSVSIALHGDVTATITVSMPGEN